MIVSLLCRNKELQKRVTGDLEEVLETTFPGGEIPKPSTEKSGGMWLKCPSLALTWRVGSYS